MTQNGKGDRPRPVDKPKFDRNHDEINWKSKEKKGKDERNHRADSNR
jgi:hypothetical protein